MSKQSQHIKELHKKTVEELYKLLAEKREGLRAFRFSMKGSRTRDTKAGAAIRKDIARVMTLLGQKHTTANAAATK